MCLALAVSQAAAGTRRWIKLGDLDEVQPYSLRCLSFDVQAARRVFLRAIHACPGAAELWRDGFACLGAQKRHCIGL